jgi:hypothetical protein
VLLCAVFALGGCNKKDDENAGVAPPGEVVVALPPADLKADGSISESGLAKIRAQSKAPKLVVAFYRSPVSDAGLKQISEFSNVHRVEAAGSKITDRGVQDFKKKLPQADVIK